MPSPETENTGNAPTAASRRTRFWLWLAFAVLIGIPVLATVIGALTAPPHVENVPVGRLLYIATDQPSERTTQLRGLFLASAGQQPQLLLHENEPQDVDAGQRDWITQPVASPDGRQVAFVKQLITIQEEKQAIVSQVWVAPLQSGSKSAPHLLLDLTQRGLKGIVGLTWQPDSRAVAFLEDGVLYTVSADTAATVTTQPIPGLPALQLTKEISATRSPAFLPNHHLVYLASEPGGQQLIVDGRSLAPVTAFALSPDGSRIAYLPTGITDHIRVINADTGQQTANLPLHWGWSLLGGRRVTSVRWSPDGRFLGYTVSKPPIPEDELFTIDVTTQKVQQLPFRTGRAAWDWVR